MPALVSFPRVRKNIRYGPRRSTPAPISGPPPPPPPLPLDYVSEALLGFLAHVTEHVCTTHAPMRVVEMWRHADREAIDALRCVGLLHVVRARRNLTWIWPSRDGCRRLRQHELLTPAAELLRHLQASVRDRRSSDISLERAAEAAGWSTDVTAIPLLLLHNTARASISAVTDDAFRLYVYDREEFLAFDGTGVGASAREPGPVRSAAELRLRYLDGEREFAMVVTEPEDFRGAMLDGITIHHGILRGADFRGASFRGATLGDYPRTRARLVAIDVFGLDLGEADLADAVFEQADLRGADLTDARIDGAHFDSTTQVSEAALSRARWEVVFLDGRAVHRGHWADAVRSEVSREPRFSLVPDAAYQTWTLARDDVPIKTVKDAGGVRLIALLMANAGRSIHALDLHAILERRPPQLGALAPADHETDDVRERLRALGLREPIDPKPELDQRLRACVRELDRVEAPIRSQLLSQMKAELQHRRLNLSGIPYVQNIVNKLRKQATRALATLAGDAQQPLLAAIEIGEFSSYKRR